MFFYLKRFSAALVANKRWGAIVPLSLLLYLVYVAAMDLRYLVIQPVGPYNPEIPLAVAHNPVATIKFEEIVHQPGLLFLEGFSLKQVQKKILVLKEHAQLADENRLSQFVHESMSIGLGQDHLLEITFNGEDPTVGKILVDYYSQRLLTRIEDGLTRSKTLSTPSTQRPEFRGEMLISTHRSLWNQDRLNSLVVVLIISTIFTMILVAYIEFTNPAFKSEREMAQYLGLPILGIIPNVDRMIGSMPETTS